MSHQPQQMKLSIPDGPFARRLHEWAGRWATSQQRASGLVLDGGVSLTSDETVAMLRELVSLFTEEGVDLEPQLNRLMATRNHHHAHGHEHNQSPLSESSMIGTLLQIGLPMLTRGVNSASVADAGKQLAGIVERSAGPPR